jgi:hypothetical protein
MRSEKIISIGHAASKNPNQIFSCVLICPLRGNFYVCLTTWYLPGSAEISVPILSVVAVSSFFLTDRQFTLAGNILRDLAEVDVLNLGNPIQLMSCL